MNTFIFVVLNALTLIVPLIFSTRSSELFEFPKLLVIYIGAGLIFPLVLYKIYKVIIARTLSERSESKGTKQPSTSTGLLRGVYPVSGTRNDALLIFISIGLFFLSQLLSTYFSIDPHTSVFGYYSRFNGGLLSLVCYITIFAAAYLFLARVQVQKLLVTSFFGGLIVALWGLPSHFGRDFICLLAQGKFSVACWTADFYPPARMFSTLGQPNWFSTYLLVLIFVALYMLVMGYKILNNKSDQINMNILLILFALLSIENFWTNSRSGMISYIVFVPIFFLGVVWSRKLQLSKLVKRTAALAVSVYFLVLVLFAFPFASTYLNKFLPQRHNSAVGTTTATNLQPAESLNITPSSQIRKTVWKGAWELTLRYPLFGTGLETFAYAYNFTRPVEHNTFSEWEFVYNKAHNELLNYAATSGFFGLITYSLMFLAFLFPAMKFLFTPNVAKGEVGSDIRVFSLFYICAMLAIFSMNLVGFSTTATSLFFYLLPALWLVQSQPEEKTKDARSEMRDMKRDSSFLPTTPFILYVLFVVCSLFYVVSYFAADYYYARSKELKQTEDISGAYQYTQKAIDIRREPTYVDQQAFLTANLAASLRMQKDTKNSNDLAQQAIALNTETLAGSPSNVFYLKTAAKVYYLLAVSYLDDKPKSVQYMNKAIRVLQEAMRLAPTDPKIPYTLAAIIGENKPEDAKELLERVLQLKPDYVPATELLKKL